MKWVCFPKLYSPLGNWPWLRISPQSSLYVIYCLILTAWQWLMSFTCIPVQTEPNKSPKRKRLLALLLWEIGHLSSPSRSCLGRLIFIRGRWGALPAGPPWPPWMKINLPRHDLLGEERWPISQRRRAKSLFLNGLLLGSFCTGIQVKLINHCQTVRIKQ